MNRISPAARRQVPRLAAILLVLIFFVEARLPALSAGERTTLSARFSFTALSLPQVPGSKQQTIRNVNPSLARIAAWVSSVGASVALNDLDGDGLPNDLCYVDTRTDQVIVAPVPGTPARYAPFALGPAPLPYNPATMAPTGCLPGDYNEDGLTDILVYYWGRTPDLFLRRGVGPAGAPLNAQSYVRRELVPGGERWFTDTATRADLDGDGHVDLVVANYFPDGAHILDAQATNVEPMQHSMSRAYNGGAKHIFLWQGATAGPEPSVQFREVSGGLDDETNHGWTLAVGAADLDGDLLPELYFANDFGPDRLLHNESTPGHLRFRLVRGVKTLTTPSSKVLGHDSYKGMGIDFADLKNNGRLDIFVSNITGDYSLEESNFAFINTGQPDLMQRGLAPYVDESESLGLSRSGWGWDIRLGDFANDGSLEVLQAIGFVRGETNRWPELQELAMGNDELLSNPFVWPRFQAGDDLSGHQHNAFFVRAADGRYYDLAPEVGLDNQAAVTRGIATADVDGSGALSFAIANQWGASLFYRNNCPQCGAYLGLQLRLPVEQAGPAAAGDIANTKDHAQGGPPSLPAIGAQAIVHLPDGRRMMAQVDGGNGHSGKRSPELHFGLGQVAAGTTLPVDLAWRDRQGAVHRQTVMLAPGSHTLLLGAPAS